jgi:hypothetical protein
MGSRTAPQSRLLVGPAGHCPLRRKALDCSSIHLDFGSIAVQ